MAKPNFKNRTLYHCDNLPVLRGMNSESVHLIATDPPFNKNRDFHATPDSLAKGASFQDRWSWRRDIHDEWLIEIQRDYPDVWSVITTAKQVWGDGMGAYLCWLGVRLLEMHRVLREDGSLYLHCDSTASHYLKSLLDAIFGATQFRNQIVWRRNESGAKGSQHESSSWGNNYDCLLFYAKSDAVRFDPRIVRDFDSAELRRRYPKTDDNGERYHTKLTAWCQPSMGARPNLCYTFLGLDPPYPSGWRLKPERMQEEYEKGNIVLVDGKLERRSYYRDYRGVSPGNLWTETELLLGAQSSERVGFPTQKPIALYERIVEASSKEGDIVLDPFAGCATTPVAAERLGRKWIGIDIWDEAHPTVLQRLQAAGLAVPEKSGGGDTDVLPDNPRLITFGDVHYTTKPPKRKDDGEPAVLELRTPTGRGRRHPPPRQQRERLLLDLGAYCQGCGRDYGFDPRVLEVDHVSPKADGGTDAYGNLTLLCPPCNREKRDRMTLSGLQQFNRDNGYLLRENEGNIKRGRASRTRRRRRR